MLSYPPHHCTDVCFRPRTQRLNSESPSYEFQAHSQYVNFKEETLHPTISPSPCLCYGSTLIKRCDPSPLEELSSNSDSFIVGSEGSHPTASLKRQQPTYSAISMPRLPLKSARLKEGGSEEPSFGLQRFPTAWHEQGVHSQHIGGNEAGEIEANTVNHYIKMLFQNAIIANNADGSRLCTGFNSARPNSWKISCLCTQYWPSVQCSSSDKSTKIDATLFGSIPRDRMEEVCY